MGDVVVARQSEPVTPQPTVKGDSVKFATKETVVDTPLEIYAQENKTPYINELLQVDDILPEHLKESITGIDEYVEGLMSKRGYDRTTEAYKATLNRLKDSLGIDDHTSLEESVERISKYIEAEKILKSLKTVDEAKILQQMRKSPTRQLIDLVMAQIEKQGL